MMILLKPFLKYGLMALAVIGILFGMYEWGHSNGHDTGYQEAWTAQQKTIQAMVDKENAQTTAQNQKIDKVEQQSQVVAAADQKADEQQVVTVTKVVTKYIHDNPTTANNCGWDTGAVTAINSIIGGGPTTTAGVHNEDHPIVEARTGRHLHLRVAVRMRKHTTTESGAFAYRRTEGQGERGSADAGQVPRLAEADSSPLQSGAVFEYHSNLRDAVQLVPTSTDILVGPDFGRLQPVPSATGRPSSIADPEQHNPELPVPQLSAA